MTVLAGGASVIEGGEPTETEGSRRYRVPISQAMGARDIAQTISIYSPGVAPARRNPTGEEVLFVVHGEGSCYIDGHRYALAPGTAVFVPPGSSCHIDNTGVGNLTIVSVVCPEDEETEVGIEPAERKPNDTAPFLTVRESDREPIVAGDRTFKFLVNQEVGASRVTQFIGVIPPGRVPMHHHTYEEAIYIIEGEGRVWTNDGTAEFSAGSSIYLPRGVSHSLENTGRADIRLLGVFHPSGSPDVSYSD
ncbi:MAG TPA: cupin domain-containing protein [Blastocatellia bacterium]|nr:cupin domain-containing protein [Blastocatellia bacterium]